MTLCWNRTHSRPINRSIRTTLESKLVPQVNILYSTFQTKMCINTISGQMLRVCSEQKGSPSLMANMHRDSLMYGGYLKRKLGKLILFQAYATTFNRIKEHVITSEKLRYCPHFHVHIWLLRALDLSWMRADLQSGIRSRPQSATQNILRLALTAVETASTTTT